MGKHRDLTVRLRQAEKMVERNAKAMDRHEKRAKRCSGKGAYEEATKHCNLYERAARLKRKWQRETRKLSTQLRAREVLTKRAPQVDFIDLHATGVT